MSPITDERNSIDQKKNIVKSVAKLKQTKKILNLNQDSGWCKIHNIPVAMKPF